MAENADLTPRNHGKPHPGCVRPLHCDQQNHVAVHGIDGNSWFRCVPQFVLLSIEIL
ncbi:MAG TPA: hypothetical protein PKD54_11685 [Pirellulaceae bacterium]|nr:hypothetical protein [Pirellulaceae bacterium]